MHRRKAQGDAYLLRFPDEFPAVFRYKEDAERFEWMLKDRLEGFGFETAPEKTKL